MLTTLDDAQNAYVHALRELELSDRDAYRELNRDYQSATQSAQEEYQERCSKASEAYDPGGGPVAYDEYVSALQKAWSEGQDKLASLYRDYQEATAKLLEASGRAYRDAFRDYVRAAQEGMASLDVDAVFPDTLLKAAQGMYVTAQWAANAPWATPPTPGAGDTGRAKPAKSNK